MCVCSMVGWGGACITHQVCEERVQEQTAGMSKNVNIGNAATLPRAALSASGNTKGGRRARQRWHTGGKT